MQQDALISGELVGRTVVAPVSVTEKIYFEFSSKYSIFAFLYAESSLISVNMRSHPSINMR